MNDREEAFEAESEKSESLSIAQITELIESICDKKFKKLAKAKKEPKEKEPEGYLLPSDIENIISDFTPIENQIREQEGTVSDSYLNLLCDLVEDTITARIKDIIRRRKTERALEEATAERRDFEQAPRFFRPFRRLWQKTPNRAMQLIIDREALNARAIQFEQEVQNEQLDSEISERENNYYSQFEEQPIPKKCGKWFWRRNSQPSEMTENGQNTDEGASDAREHTEQTDEQTPADKPEETSTDGVPDEPEPVNQTEESIEELPRRRSRTKPEEPNGENVSEQINIDEATQGGDTGTNPV